MDKPTMPDITELLFDNLQEEPTLEDALTDAVETCWLNINDLEERGGVIIYRGEEYQFIPLTNSNTGTPIAPGLFTADRFEYAEKIIPLFKEGWRHYASFHTHPQFPPWPSNIDMNELFPGFPINYIYSGLTDKLFKYTWINPKNINEGCVPEEIEL